MRRAVAKRDSVPPGRPSDGARCGVCCELVYWRANGHHSEDSGGVHHDGRDRGVVMKIAIYTLTRDRLQYTKDCFTSLWQNAGMPFDHYVFDNGSEDGTREWLMHEYTCTFSQTSFTNHGISVASNFMVRHILMDNYDIICKFDNDAFIRTPNILPQICDVMREAGENWILSPRVEGINKQPKRARNVEIAGHPVGVTAIVGGLFHVVPAAVYRRYMEQGGYPESLPLAKGQDDHFCHWFKTTQKGNCGYIEDIVVEHYETTDGQAKRYESYFERKWREEKA